MSNVEDLVVHKVEGPALVHGETQFLLLRGGVAILRHLVLHKGHFLHQHAHRLQERTLRAHGVVGKEFLVGQALAVCGVDAQDVEGLTEDGVVGLKYIHQEFLAQLVGGGGEEKECQVLRGRSNLGVLPVQDNAGHLGVCGLLAAEQHVFLPQLAVNDGVEG